MAKKKKSISEFCNFDNLISKISYAYHTVEWGMTKEEYMEQARQEMDKEMSYWTKYAKAWDEENEEENEEGNEEENEIDFSRI